MNSLLTAGHETTATAIALGTGWRKVRFIADEGKEGPSERTGKSSSMLDR